MDGHAEILDLYQHAGEPIVGGGSGRTSCSHYSGRITYSMLGRREFGMGVGKTIVQIAMRGAETVKNIDTME